MPIKVLLNDRLLDRGLMLTQLQKKVGLTLANLSILKTGKGKAIRFSTLEKLCETLECQPGELLVYEGIARGPLQKPAAAAPQPVGRPGRKPAPTISLKMKPLPRHEPVKDEAPELPLSPIWPEK